MSGAFELQRHVILPVDIAAAMKDRVDQPLVRLVLAVQFLGAEVEIEAMAAR